MFELRLKELFTKVYREKPESSRAVIRPNLDITSNYQNIADQYPGVKGSLFCRAAKEEGFTNVGLSENYLLDCLSLWQ